MHNTDKSNTFIRKTPNNWDFPQLQQFSQISCGFTRVKHKYFSYHAKFIVALFYKINPVQITTIVAENTKHSLNLVPHTIEISIQICEKFSPIVNSKFGIFSQVPQLLLHHNC